MNRHFYDLAARKQARSWQAEARRVALTQSGERSSSVRSRLLLWLRRHGRHFDRVMHQPEAGRVRAGIAIPLELDRRENAPQR